MVRVLLGAEGMGNLPFCLHRQLPQRRGQQEMGNGADRSQVWGDALVKAGADN